MSDDYGTTIPYASLPRRQPFNGLRLIVDYNPCFLLSAVCMLFGCRLLNDAVNARTGDVRGALWLILTINVYEFCLLGVAMLIHRLKGMRRDVGILLVAAVIFLCDVTFVAGDLSIARPGVGWIVAMVLTALAAIKTILAMRLLQSPKRGRVVAVVTTQVAMLLLLPAVLKQISARHGGELPMAALYAGWWVAGLLPIFWRHVLDGPRLGGLARVYVVFPYVAIVGHLLACTWVFNLPFHGTCYAPLLIGWAIVVGQSRTYFGRTVATNLQWGLAAGAVLLAIGSPVALAGSIGHLAVSPLRLTLLGAAVVNVYGLVVLRHPIFAITIGLCAGLVLLGPTFDDMSQRLRDFSAMIVNFLERSVPRTASQWGILTIGVSFVLLAVGAVASLIGRRPKLAVAARPA